MRVGLELEFFHGTALNSWKRWCCFQEGLHINYFRAISAVQCLDFTVVCARPVEGLGIVARSKGRGRKRKRIDLALIPNREGRARSKRGGSKSVESDFVVTLLCTAPFTDIQI